jgi:hypothetical protein
LRVDLLSGFLFRRFRHTASLKPLMVSNMPSSPLNDKPQGSLLKAEKKSKCAELNRISD